MRRYALRDDQWERIKHLLPGREGSVGVTAADNRLFLEAVLYRYRAGIPWRDLPERFGDWKTCIDASAVGPSPVSGDAMRDSTIVRAHQHSAGAQKKPARTKRSGTRAAD